NPTRMRRIICCAPLLLSGQRFPDGQSMRQSIPVAEYLVAEQAAAHPTAACSVLCHILTQKAYRVYRTTRSQARTVTSVTTRQHKATQSCTNAKKPWHKH